MPKLLLWKFVEVLFFTEANHRHQHVLYTWQKHFIWQWMRAGKKCACVRMCVQCFRRHRGDVMMCTVVCCRRTNCGFLVTDTLKRPCTVVHTFSSFFLRRACCNQMWKQLWATHVYVIKVSSRTKQGRDSVPVQRWSNPELTRPVGQDGASQRLSIHITISVSFQRFACGSSNIHCVHTCAYRYFECFCSKSILQVITRTLEHTGS